MLFLFLWYRSVKQTVNKAAHRGHRRSQLVRYVGKEAVTHSIVVFEVCSHLVERVAELLVLLDIIIGHGNGKVAVAYFFGDLRYLFDRVGKFQRDDVHKEHRDRKYAHHRDDKDLGDVPHIVLLHGFGGIRKHIVDRSAGRERHSRDVNVLTERVTAPAVNIRTLAIEIFKSLFAYVRGI